MNGLRFESTGLAKPVNGYKTSVLVVFELLNLRQWAILIRDEQEAVSAELLWHRKEIKPRLSNWRKQQIHSCSDSPDDSQY